MKPEKKDKIDPKEKYTEKGIPEEWVEPLQKLGYVTVEKLINVKKPGKLHQEMMGYRKINKLEINTVTLEEVTVWLGK
jgi:lysyl-tRNA synthetase class 2